jgi:hypothetical protein
LAVSPSKKDDGWERGEGREGASAEQWNMDMQPPQTKFRSINRKGDLRDRADRGAQLMRIGE